MAANFGLLNTTILAKGNMILVGTWANDDLYNGMTTHTAGSKAQFQFHGVQIFVFGIQAFTGSTFEMDEDATTVATQTRSDPLNPFGRVLLYSSPMLLNGNHVLTVTNQKGIPGTLKLAKFIVTSSQGEDAVTVNPLVSSDIGQSTPSSLPPLTSASSTTTEVPKAPSSALSAAHDNALTSSSSTVSSQSVTTILTSGSTTPAPMQTVTVISKSESTSENTGSKSLPSHLIPAIVIPIVILCAIIGFGVFYRLRKKQRSRSWASYDSSNSVAYATSTRSHSDFIQHSSEGTRVQSFLTAASSDSLFHGTPSDIENNSIMPLDPANYSRTMMGDRISTDLTGPTTTYMLEKTGQYGDEPTQNNNIYSEEQSVRSNQEQATPVNQEQRIPEIQEQAMPQNQDQGSLLNHGLSFSSLPPPPPPYYPR